MDLFEEFQILVNAMNREGVDYAVAGALALAIHGIPRATTDIDILVRPEDAARVRQLAHGNGYGLPAAPMTFAQSGLEVQRVTKITDGEALTLDLLLVNDQLEEVWKSRIQIEMTRGHAWVVSREGLMKMKAMSGRLRDLADLERLAGKDEA